MAQSNTTGIVLGTIGTVIWCIQLSPQIYFLYKKKNAEGFPPIFMFLWCLSGIPMAIYFIVSDSYIPMQIQPHLFTCLCSIAWIQSMYYPPHSIEKKKIIALASSFYLLWLGCEVGFSIWLRPLYAKGVEWPDLVFGIVSCVILALGLLPPYWELFKRKGRVIGINFLFLGLDSTGAVFSMASMLVGEFDAMGMSLYVIILALEIGIFVSHSIWWLRFRWRKGKFTDDDEKQAQGNAFSDTNYKEADDEYSGGDNDEAEEEINFTNKISYTEEHDADEERSIKSCSAAIPSYVYT